VSKLIFIINHEILHVFSCSRNKSEIAIRETVLNRWKKSKRKESKHAKLKHRQKYFAGKKKKNRRKN
jgi:hypothetical protein